MDLPNEFNAGNDTALDFDPNAFSFDAQVPAGGLPGGDEPSIDELLALYQTAQDQPGAGASPFPPSPEGGDPLGAFGAFNFGDPATDEPFGDLAGLGALESSVPEAPAVEMGGFDFGAPAAGSADAFDFGSFEPPASDDPLGAPSGFAEANLGAAPPFGLETEAAPDFGNLDFGVEGELEEFVPDGDMTVFPAFEAEGTPSQASGDETFAFELPATAEPEAASFAPAEPAGLDFALPEMSAEPAGLDFALPEASTGAADLDFALPEASTGPTGLDFALPEASAEPAAQGFELPEASAGTAGMDFSLPGASVGEGLDFGFELPDADSTGASVGFDLGGTPSGFELPDLGGDAGFELPSFDAAPAAELPSAPATSGEPVFELGAPAGVFEAPASEAPAFELAPPPDSLATETFAFELPAAAEPEAASFASPASAEPAGLDFALPEASTGAADLDFALPEASTGPTGLDFALSEASAEPAAQGFELPAASGEPAAADFALPEVPAGLDFALPEAAAVSAGPEFALPEPAAAPAAQDFDFALPAADTVEAAPTFDFGDGTFELTEAAPAVEVPAFSLGEAAGAPTAASPGFDAAAVAAEPAVEAALLPPEPPTRPSRQGPDPDQTLRLRDVGGAPLVPHTSSVPVTAQAVVPVGTPEERRAARTQLTQVLGALEGGVEGIQSQMASLYAELQSAAVRRAPVEEIQGLALKLAEAKAAVGASSPLYQQAMFLRRMADAYLTLLETL